MNHQADIHVTFLPRNKHRSAAVQHLVLFLFPWWDPPTSACFSWLTRERVVSSTCLFSCAFSLSPVIKARDKDTGWKGTPQALLLDSSSSTPSWPPPFSSLSSSSHTVTTTFLFFSILPCNCLDWLEPSPEEMAHRGALSDHPGLLPSHLALGEGQGKTNPLLEALTSLAFVR